MKIIDEKTVVVLTSDELKNVLENNNTYTYIYLGENIVLTSGIKISSTKPNIIIDGTYENIRHTLEDKKSLSASDTIYVTTGTLKVIVKNVDITGNNYYGVIYVPESTAYKDVVIEYNNVVYVGPQMSFNPNGLTRFIDSTITVGDNSLTTGNEVAECNKIEIGGTTKILHTSKSNSSFWFRNDNPYLKILTNANVDFTSESRELIYGVNNLNFEIMDGAKFKVTSKSGMAYGTFGTGTTIIHQNASFTLKQTGSNGYATWNSYGIITMEKSSSLIIINDFTGIATTNNNIRFYTASSGLKLNDPELVFLYNKVTNVITTNSTSTFDFTFSRINLFSAAVNIEEDITETNKPVYFWYKTSELTNMTGTYTSSKTTLTSNNLTEEDLKILPALSNFNIVDKKAISIGTMKFLPNAVTDESLVINGITSENASVLINYNNESITVKADETGHFSYTLDNTLEIGTIITFNAKSNENLIYVTKAITIVYSGEITVDSYPNLITFDLTPISTQPLLCPKTKEIEITITDSRINSEDWNLYVTSTELTSGNDVLYDIVFKNENEITKISNDEEVLVYEGKANDGTIKTTKITWTTDEGILLNPKVPLKNNSEYKALLT